LGAGVHWRRNLRQRQGLAFLKTVEPKRYTFLFLNGSNARTYEMALTDPISKNPGPPLWVVGTDGGYLDKPVKIDPVAAVNSKLVMMSGERYLVIVDFAGYQAGVLWSERPAVFWQVVDQEHR